MFVQNYAGHLEDMFGRNSEQQHSTDDMLAHDNNRKWGSKSRFVKAFQNEN